MLIKMLQTHICWPAINKAVEYLDGEEYIVPDSLGKAFIKHGYSMEVEHEVSK